MGKFDFSNMSDEDLAKIAGGQASSTKRDLSTMSDDDLMKIANGSPVSVAEKKSSAGQAALEGFGQGATMGYLPHLQSATAPLAAKAFDATRAVGRFFGAEDDGYRASEDLGSYTDRRDENIKRQQVLAEENPLAYQGANVAGAISSSFIPGAIAGKIAKGANATKALVTADQAKALTLADKAKALANTPTSRNVAAGATIGLVQNPGDAEGETSPFQIMERLENAKNGGLISGVASVGAKGLAELTRSIGKGAKSIAATKAFKALGGTAKDLEKARAQGSADRIGQTLLDEKMVTPFATPKSIAGKLDTAIDDASSAIESTIEKINSGSSKIGQLNPEQAKKLSASFFRPKEVSQKLKDDLIAKYEGAPIEELQPALNKIDLWFKDKPEVMSIKEVQKFKKTLYGFLKDSDFYNPNSQLGMARQGLKAVGQGAREGIEKQADTVSEMLGGAGGEIKAANRRLGDFLGAEKVAQKGIGRTQGNRMISLTDTIAGVGGMGAGGVAGALVSGDVEGAAKGSLLGLGAGAVNKFGRTYGNSLMATGANSVAKKLLAIPKYAEIAQSNPAQFQMLVNKLTQEPESESAIDRKLKAAQK